MADILRLQTDVPEVIAVEFTDGLPVKSNYGGDQIMFSLCDGRKIFLPAFAAKKITASGVRPKEQFEICKRETAQGNRVRRQGPSLMGDAPTPAQSFADSFGKLRSGAESDAAKLIAKAKGKVGSENARLPYDPPHISGSRDEAYPVNASDLDHLDAARYTRIPRRGRCQECYRARSESQRLRIHEAHDHPCSRRSAE